MSIIWADVTAGAGGRVTGQLGEGLHDRYLVTEAPGGRFVLARWSAATWASGNCGQSVREAAQTAIGVTGLPEGRLIAEKYEAGLDDDSEPAWQHTGIQERR
jgi:hypothetical protein